MFARTFTLIAIIAVAISVKAVCDSGVPGSTHVVNPGDTCWGIATEAGIDVPRLQAANPGIKSLSAGMVKTRSPGKVIRSFYSFPTVVLTVTSTPSFLIPSQWPFRDLRSSSLLFAIELSLFAFQKLAPPDDGRIDVTWNCDEPDAPESMCGN
ncbi:hypothetical protein ARMSODRAFT_1000666 [Armillaria solidipes]|uniref:LysM domain-containing protein n=1 Tax=Armillaria solidipes TaxID=1076256 RepID=A0A2H3C9H0_9AGAR|nr:hypothetical protein ARMSODRAFT_1000666 [Armillaria solidipes]